MKTWRWRLAQRAELKWWEWYLRDQPRADYLSRKRRYWRRVLAETGAAPTSGQRILDAGCGPAGIFIVLDQNEVDALDPLLEQYRERLPHFSPDDYPNVRFLADPLETYRPAYCYDTVFCLNAINHVADLPACIAALGRALAPGGRLVVSVDAHNYSFFRRLFRLLPFDILHPHQYCLDEYRAMIAALGLREVRVALLKKGFFFNYHALVFQRDSTRE